MTNMTRCETMVDEVKTVAVACPFYKWNDRTRIACEGFAAGETLVRSFGSTAKRRKVQEERCVEGYKSCEMYRTLLEKKYPEAL